ncbi:MAG: Stp1/IreP family PP2C-type Ser/Thr phosphatase [Solirubrobacterales bacterium]
MLRIVEEAARTDTGRQRRANEDAYFARSPVYVVADGMGGAQAGEVASKIATDVFDQGLADDGPEQALTQRVREANRRIFELARADESRAGMGTTLTGVALSGDEASIVHVGDSRAYLYRDGELRQLTRDHSLVEELRRQGQLTSEEAEEHPQRSIITRALGPELDVELDVHTHQVRSGDVFLLCSDGLTSMVREDAICEILARRSSLAEAVDRLIAEANSNGGRDNITVVCFQIGGETENGSESAGSIGETITNLNVRDLPAAEAPAEEAVEAGKKRLVVTPATGRRRWPRRVAATVAALAVLGGAAFGVNYALHHTWFISQDDHGLVALYRGFPYELPGDVKLYSEHYVSSVPSRSLSSTQRRRLLDHQLRSREDAADVVRSLELGENQR